MLDKLTSQGYIPDHKTRDCIVFQKPLPILGKVTIYLYPEHSYYEYAFQNGERNNNLAYAEFFRSFLAPYTGREL